MIDIAFVTFEGKPGIDPDDTPLVDALKRRGLLCGAAVWDDASVDWSLPRIALLRSTWDYYLKRDEFLAWAGKVSALTALWNPLHVIRWNTHKGYLKELEERGAPVVPTVHLPAGGRANLARICSEHGWHDTVIKPAVSADSWETIRAGVSDPAAGQAHLDRLLPSRDMLVQPRIPSVETLGERCLVFLDGDYSHAVRKRSLFQGGRWAGPEGTPVEATADELAAAREVLRALCESLTIDPHPLLYARVDLVRDEEDTPRLLELELTEPTLFLLDHPEATERLADAIVARLPG